MHRQLDAWGEEIPVPVQVVANRCWQRLRAQSPWREMPMDDAFGGLRRLLGEFLNEARDPASVDRNDRIRAAAVEHGRFRRAQRCAPRVLAQDIEALGSAIADALRGAGVSAALVADFLVILEPSLEAIADAAALGWMRFPPTPM
jgi:hypothetical protein